MHKKLLLCVCAAAAAATFGCNESVEWKPAQLKAVCGNSIVEAGEVCDTVTTLTCADFDSSKNWVSGGQPICTSSCQLAQGTCAEQGGSQSKTCNNGILEAGEACDGNQIADAELTCESLKGKGATGSLKCNDQCQVDASECVAPTNCGNGQIDDGEQCDGDNFGDATCQSLVENSTGGTLACVNCTAIDTAGCELPSAEPECGNNQVEDGEECDGTSFKPDASVDCGDGMALDALKCKADCSAIDVEASCKAIPDGCRNGQQDAGEECDVDADGNVTVFTNEAYCGEGKIATETPVCNAFCKIDRENSCIDAPEDLCGNGILDNGEACDLTVFPADFQNPDCGEGKAIAALTCKEDCSGIDMDATCQPIPDGCGDGQQTEGEECDVDADGNVVVFAENFCGDNQKAKDVVTCNAFCQIDRVASCEDVIVAECGNGILETGESCDTNAFPAEFVAPECGEGKALSVLTCLDDCSAINLEASCEAIPDGCRNGEQDLGEECDVDADGNVTVFTNEVYCGEGQIATETPVCNAFCKIDREKSCEDVIPETCGNGEQDLDEECEVDADGNVTVFTNEVYCVDGKVATETPVCTACIIDRELSCTDPEPETKCGNHQIDEGEECDFDEEGNPIHLLGASCANALENEEAVGTLSCNSECKVDASACYVVPANCGNNAIDGDEICDNSMPLYTPMACLHSPAAADDEHVLSDNDIFWIPSASLMCSAVCSLDTANACVSYDVNDIQTVEVAKVMTTAQNTWQKLYGRGVSLSNGMSYKFSNPTLEEVDENGNITKPFEGMEYGSIFGPWKNAGAEDGTFNTQDYIQYNLKNRLATIVDDFEYVSIFFKYRRVSSLSPTRYAVALYDGEEYVGLVANFSIKNFTGWGYSGELAISIKGLNDPVIRIHNYDAGMGFLYVKDLTVTGINLTPAAPDEGGDE